MTRETVFVVQSFSEGRAGALKTDQAIRCRSGEAARRMAERLSASKPGVVAFSTSGDADLGDFDDRPTILFKTGQLPAAFED